MQMCVIVQTIILSVNYHIEMISLKFDVSVFNFHRTNYLLLGSFN